MDTLPTTSDLEKPILIVDKVGSLGHILLTTLVRRHVVIYVSKEEPSPLPQAIYIPFRRKIPVIPDTSFSHLFVVYQGEQELLTALPAFVKKARESRAKLFLLTSVFYLNEKGIQVFHSKHPEVTLIIVGDMFGESSFAGSHVQYLLDEAKKTGHVTLPGGGLLSLYPVATEDVVEGVIALAMGNTTAGVYALFPKYPPTALSFARVLKKLYPLLHIDFAKETEHFPTLSVPKETVYLFGNAYPLEARLKKIDLKHTPLASRVHIKRKKRLAGKNLSFKQRQIVALISVVLFILALPLLLSVGLSTISGALLLSAQGSLEKGNIYEAKRSSHLATSLFSVASVATATMKQGASLIGVGDELVGFERTIQTGGVVAESVHEGISAFLLVQGVTQGTSKAPEADFQTGLNKGREALRLMQRLIAEDRLPERYREEMKKWQPTIAMVSNTMDTYPTLLGFEKEQRYLVLFQNNYELRPTGGFIGSYGILRVDQGRVVDFTIHDVYDADGKLKEKIVPPFPLARYMGASNWFMRDSNYYLDFPTSAATAANFLKLETGEVVDGVIAIDVFFLASLLEATGPLPMPDYNETLTQDNFFLVTQTNAEKDFFPGSTQKKDFLRAVRTSLEEKFATKGELSYATLLSVLSNAVTEKHVLFAFADSKVQKLFTVNNLSAAMWDGRQEKDGQLQDYLALNEANIGLNKGNYYLKREIEQRVAIDGEGRVSEEVDVTYTNTSTTASPYGGEYKSYLRVVLPEDATLTGVRLDGREQEVVPAVTDRTRFSEDGFVPPRGLEVEEATEEGKKVIGIFVSIPTQKSQTVTFLYARKTRATVNQTTFSYDHKIVKQPGTDKDLYTLEVSYPMAVRLVTASQPVSDLGGKLIFERPLTQDIGLTLEFAKQ